MQNVLISRILRKALGCSSKFRIYSPDKFEGAEFLLGPVLITDSTSCELRIRTNRASALLPLLVGDLSDEEVCHFLLSGIRGFLCYREVERKLHKAVEVVASGRIYAPHLPFETFVNYARRVVTVSGCNSMDSLTPRQLEIVQLLRKRCSNKEISSMLGISENTVKFHLAKLFSKLGIHDRQAAADFIAQGLNENSIKPDNVPASSSQNTGELRDGCENGAQSGRSAGIRGGKTGARPVPFRLASIA